MARSSGHGKNPSSVSPLRRIGAGIAGAVALGGLAVGCAPGNPGMNVIFQVAPSDECLWDPNGVERVVESRLDVDPLTPAMVGSAGFVEFRPMYVAQFVVANNVINRFNMMYPVTGDVNDITVTSAEIELLDTAGRRLPGGFYRTRAGGVVESALGDQPGRGLVRVDVIPSTVADTLATNFADLLEGEGLVVARVVLIGVTQGGSEVRTSPYVMPIDVCYGCLWYNGMLEPGESPGCTPGQDAGFVLGGYTRTPACVDSGECASGLCVLGHCARDVI